MPLEDPEVNQERIVGVIRWQRKPFADGRMGDNTFVGKVSSSNKDIVVAVKRVSKFGEYSVAEEEIRQLKSSMDLPPYVVRYYAIEHNLDFWYLAMEPCEETLSTYICTLYKKSNNNNACDRNNCDELSLRACQQAASGLSYIHRNSLIHGDIRPNSIVVCTKRKNDVTCKIAYLGLRRRISDNELNLSSRLDYEVLDWLAPELWHTPSKQDYKVDLWSFGCALHHALTGGRHPFSGGLHRRALNIISGNYDEDILRAHCVLHQRILPEDLVKLITCMISLNPSDRPDASKVVAILKECILSLCAKN